MTDQQTNLQRFAAVIPVFVEAGCPAFPYELKRVSLDIYTLDDDIQDTDIIIAVLKEWFREKVVVWAPYYVKLWYSHSTEDWHWSITNPVGLDVLSRCCGDPDPTEATIQCAEALARVIGDKQ